MVIRKLSRKEAEEQWGVKAPEGGQEPERKQERGAPSLSDQLQEATEGRRPSRRELERAAAEIIAGLHEAKQELAKELEANLKQLRTVLEETQRIAKEMEAVLKEAKAEPDPDRLSRGGRPDRDRRRPTEEPQGREAKGGEFAWDDPRSRREDGSDRGQRREHGVRDHGPDGNQPDEAWNPPRFGGAKQDSWEPPDWRQVEGEPPLPWTPPQEENRPH